MFFDGANLDIRMLWRRRPVCRLDSFLLRYAHDVRFGMGSEEISTTSVCHVIDIRIDPAREIRHRCRAASPIQAWRLHADLITDLKTLPIEVYPLKIATH